MSGAHDGSELLASCLYEGMVRHQRFEPVEFGFRYPIQLLYLDLDELDRVFAGSRLWSVEGRTPASFRRSDHLGNPDEPLDESVRRLVEARLGRRPRGPVRLLTALRHLGLVFNPISVYYLFEPDGETLDAVVGEVTNTPWGERHCYVLDLSDRAEGGPAASEHPTDRGHDAEPRAGRARRATPKAFHVSPFMEMAMGYDWRIQTPGRSLTLSIRSELSSRSPSSRRAAGAPYFQADLALTRRAIEPATLRRAFWRAPFLSGRVLLGIYWQALRLARRRVPIVRHPPARWPQHFADPDLIAPGRRAAPMEDQPA